MINKGRKNILIIHHGSGLGGGLIALLGIIRELRSDYNISVFTIFNSEAIEYIKREGVNVIENNSFYYQKVYRIFSHSAASYSSPLRLILKFYNFLNFVFNKYFYSRIALKNVINKFDLVYLNSTFISDWAYFPKKRDKKVIVHVREPLKTSKFNIYSSIIKRNINKFCDQIIAISYDNAERINIRNKTSIIYDPVVTNLVEGKSEPVLQTNYKYFAYLGGSARIKGFEQMVNCLAFLNDNIRVFFLGNYTSVKRIDSYYRAQRDLLNKMRKSEKCIFVGKSDNPLFYLRNSIANISPFSKPHAALPILESFSLGIPVIVSDIKGMDELVTDGDNGFLFKNNDPFDLASKINYLSNAEEDELISLRHRSMQRYNQIRNSSKSLKDIIMSIV